MTAIESAGPDADSALPNPIVLPAPQRRNDSLDGLRAIAVLLVMGVHIAFPFMALGWLGVDIFFVLSGFLITTLLCNEYARNGRISLSKFWGRRFLRLMPVYWLYVGSLTAYMLLGPANQLHAHGNWTPGEYILALWTYFVNLAPAGGIWTHQHLTLHLWSLAVEEQFYFIWPPLCVLILRFPPTMDRRAAADRPDSLLPPRRAALDSESHSLDPRSWNRDGIHARALYARSPALAASIVCCGPVALDRGRPDRRRLPGVGPAGTQRPAERGPDPSVRAALAMSAVYLCAAGMLWYGPFDRTARSLSWPPLAYLGRISYGVYVYHMVAQLLVWDLFLRNIEHWPQIPKYGLRCLLYFGITLALSVTSYRLIERPFLRIKDRLR